MGDKGMIITEESPETEGFFGIGAEKKGCLWRNYREKRSCDICLKSFERDVFTGLYTGAFEFPFFGLKRVFVGYKKRPFDFCWPSLSNSGNSCASRRVLLIISSWDIFN